MALQIEDLERRLLTLTRQRIAVDSEWVKVTEQLLAARAIGTSLRNEEVPVVSETTETNPTLQPVSSADIHTAQSTGSSDLQHNNLQRSCQFHGAALPAVVPLATRQMPPPPASAAETRSDPAFRFSTTLGPETSSPFNVSVPAKYAKNVRQRVFNQGLGTKQHLRPQIQIAQYLPSTTSVPSPLMAINANKMPEMHAVQQSLPGGCPQARHAMDQSSQQSVIGPSILSQAKFPQLIPLRQGQLSPRVQTSQSMASNVRLISTPLQPNLELYRRRRRSPSMEILEERPTQRLRVSTAPSPEKRVATPPLNYPVIKVEHVRASDIEKPSYRSELTSMQAPNPDGPLIRALDSHNDVASTAGADENQQDSSVQAPIRSLFHRQLIAPDPDRVNAVANPRSDDEREPEDDEESSFPGDESHYSRLQSDSPAVTSAYDRHNMPTLVQRMALRRPFNAYRVPEHRPLPYAERQELELRYCARVAMIIGSKRCVAEPAAPYADKNIFTLMKEKFGRTSQEVSDSVDPESLYRSAADFVTDARGLLKQYVRLGHCEDCPFRPTGNERIMCWRMRLESVLDEKMRGLKKCLKECEDLYEADDVDGRAAHVDNWFPKEELIDEVPLI